ncbi:uncharacterized protein LOC106176446 [Lingula anatina]|uniref:Uncharacterized protein LOC106176446 n=1 Tax=Lingula anatina TaxID=7574 RepID=A0A1S3JVA3_LINAN|nr:uncharacterized protein LOC106176446 [Lingula anatina]XP_023931701.1 uncharacterized protein LOC106176446 [Lingula anatina]|eukprot:XP_013414288.1 uncharacterized protein LOC106176446 [Lingula anatina]
MSEQVASDPIGKSVNETVLGQSSQRLCTVCDEPASGIYFGALVCLACKSFYIRCTREGHKTDYRCAAVGRCLLDKPYRVRCQQCRFQKCLSVGMHRKERPVAISPDEGQNLCKVCGYMANGVHFGVETCEGCKKFFRRGLKECATYHCKALKDCAINPKNRNDCRYCRYQKCLAVGMSRDAIKMGRPKKYCGSGNSQDSASAVMGNGHTTETTVKRMDFSEPVFEFHEVTGNHAGVGLDQSPALDNKGCTSTADAVTPHQKQIAKIYEVLNISENGHPADSAEANGACHMCSNTDTSESKLRALLEGKCNDDGTTQSGIQQTFQKDGSLEEGWKTHIPMQHEDAPFSDDSMRQGAHTSSSPQVLPPSGQEHYWVHSTQSIGDSEDTFFSVLPVVENFTHVEMEKLLMSINNQQQSEGGYSESIPAEKMMKDISQNSSGGVYRDEYAFESQGQGMSVGSSFSPPVSGWRDEAGSKEGESAISDDHEIMSTMCRFLGLSTQPAQEPPLQTSALYDTLQKHSKQEVPDGQNSLSQWTQGLLHESTINFAVKHSQTQPSDHLIDEFFEEVEAAQQLPKSKTGSFSSSAQMSGYNQFSPLEGGKRKLEQDDESRHGQCVKNAPHLEWNWGCLNPTFNSPRQEMNKRFLCESYWFKTCFSENHKEEMTPDLQRLIENTVREFHIMVDGCDEDKLPKTPENANYDPAWPKKGKDMGHWKHVQRRIVRNTMYQVAFAMSLEGFRKFHSEDILQSLKFGGFQAIIIFASVKWFMPDQRRFRNFWNWTIEPKNPMYYFKIELVNMGELIHMLNLDDVESSLMCALNFLSPDWHGLQNPDQMEKARQMYLQALLAHIQEKYCHGIKRLQMLLALMPQLRYLTVWHYQLLSSVKVTIPSSDSDKK